MSQDPAKKTYPTMTPQAAAMLGLPSDPATLQEPLQTVSSGDLPVANLPIAEDVQPAASRSAAPQNLPIDLGDTANKHPAVSGHDNNIGTPGKAALSQDEVIAQDIALAQPSKIPTMLKTVAPYVIVFSIGIFLYIFYFKNVDFSTWFRLPAATQTVSTPKQSVLAQLEQQNLAGYNAWISGYYFDVSEPSIISPDSDNSGNGLTNFEKYLLYLNPKSYDTLGLGRSDTESLSMGINPLTGSPLTDAQKNILNKYIDLEVAMNRLTLNHLQNPALPSTIGSGTSGYPANVSGSFGGTAVNSQGSVAGAKNIRGESTGGAMPTAAPTPMQTDTRVNLTNSQASYAVEQNNEGVVVNTSITGRLEVPSLKMDVPIIWTTNTANFETDLQSGVVHYPGTAMPGQLGTTYIAGHSSNYIWDKGAYNRVFTHLDQMALDTSFSITVTQTNGKQAIFHYVVTSQQQFYPTDQAQFKNQAKSIVALSTCWPVNSTAKRLVVFGTLTQVEQ